MNQIDYNTLHPELVPDKVQQHIIEEFLYGESNVAVSAVAGAGKTTLLHFIALAIQLLYSQSRWMMLTFNNRLARDLIQLVSKKHGSTVHAYALSILKRYIKMQGIYVPRTPKGQPYAGYPNYVIDGTGKFPLPNKIIADTLRTMYSIPKGKNPLDYQATFWSEVQMILSIVNMIREHLLSPNDPVGVYEFGVSKGITFDMSDIDIACDCVLKMTQHFQKHGQMDFKGMLYLLHVLPDIQEFIPTLDYLAIDETQDATPLMRSTYQLLAGDAKIIMTGDPQQTIGMWAGTEIDCFGIVRDMFNAIQIISPLSFRISKVQQEYLQTSKLDTRVIVPDNAVDGILESTTYVDFMENVRPGDMVLCRFNTGARVFNTLEKVSLDLLAAGIPCILIGSTYLTDIESVARYIQKYQDKNNVLLGEYNIEIIQGWIENDRQRTHTEDTRRQKALDLVQNSLANFHLYAEFYQRQKSTFDLDDFVEYCRGLYDYKSYEAVTLTSIHRGKGRQSKRVWLLHGEAIADDIFDDTLPVSRRIEALNLMYVALTRAKRETYIIDFELPQEYPTVEEIIDSAG